MSLLDALFLESHPINVWIAIRTDGNKGCGTQDDPYNGGTAQRFDEIMAGLAADTRVHLGPGTFETGGYTDAVGVVAGWEPKGLKIGLVRAVGGMRRSGRDLLELFLEPVWPARV